MTIFRGLVLRLVVVLLAALAVTVAVIAATASTAVANEVGSGGA